MVRVGGPIIFESELKTLLLYFATEFNQTQNLERKLENDCH